LPVVDLNDGTRLNKRGRCGTLTGTDQLLDNGLIDGTVGKFSDGTVTGEQLEYVIHNVPLVSGGTGITTLTDHRHDDRQIVLYRR
jgi:hypothetical protein